MKLESKKDSTRSSHSTRPRNLSSGPLLMFRRAARACVRAPLCGHCLVSSLELKWDELLWLAGEKGEGGQTGKEGQLGRRGDF